MKKIALFCVLVMVVGGVKASSDVLSYAHIETEHEDHHLLVEAMWYKVPAMDVIEVIVSEEQSDMEHCLHLEFYLRYPDGDTTETANIPLEGECLGEAGSVSVKFYIWCHDFGGWSVFLFSEGAFKFIGRTEMDFPIGEWAVIVVDQETDEVVAELPLYVEIFKPRGIVDLLSKGKYWGAE
ncbi:MAG: hypothetical protein PVF58_00745 [Candidatus Methanofastidiosia archaeon]|jgi:hypothetical protein